MLRRGTDFNNKNNVAYERKQKVLKRFIKDYQPPMGGKEEVETA
jgi:hypothetical protein